MIMTQYTDIGRHPCPDDFKYASVMRKGKPVHDGDSFSLHHPPMKCGKRAKIFAPFAALRGFDFELICKDVIYEEKRPLDDDRIRALNDMLCLLHEKTFRRRLAQINAVTAEAEYYVPCTDEHNEAYQKKGIYRKVRGIVHSADPLQRVLRIGDEEISFDDLYSVIIPDSTGESI